MKKSFKLKMISLMGLFMCVAMAFGIMMSVKPTRSASALSYGTGEFVMQGMSIRYSEAEGDDGIRFGVKLKRSIYDSLIADNNAVAGIFVIPFDQIEKAQDGNRYLDIFSAANSGAQYGILYDGNKGINNWNVGSDYATGVVYLHGFPAASFNRPIAARAYIDWDNNSTTAVYYSDTVTKSMSDVALAVRTDYTGSNAYGTTATQYAKLDNYLNTYTVKFYDDFYNVSATQNVKYGNTFSTPANPTARTGYTLDGWCEQNGASTYSSTVFNMSAGDKTVKYAKNFKAKYSKTSGATTFEKPTLGTWLYGANDGTTQSVSAIKLKGANLLSGATVTNGSNYLLQATFTRTAATEVGFVITTQNASAWNGSVKNLMFVYRSSQGDMYLWGTNIYASLGSVSMPAVGSSVTLQVVYKDDVIFVFVNGTKVKEISALTAISGGGVAPKTAIGTSGDINFGLVSLGTATTFTDWRYSTNQALIDEVAPTVLGSWLYGDNSGTTQSASEVSVKGAYLLKDAEVANGSDYLLNATFTRNANATEFGFVITTQTAATWNANTTNPRNLLFVYRKTQGDLYFYGNGIWHSLGAASAPVAGQQMTMKLVHKGTMFYAFIGDTKVAEVSETATSDGGASPKSAIGTSGNIKFGLASLNGLTTFTDWGYTTDSEAIKELVPDYITLDKPSAGTWQYGGGAQYTVSGGNLALKGAYTINGATFTTGTDYMVQTSFTRASGADEFGFLVTTDNNWNGTQKNLWIVCRTSNGKFYVWGENPGLWWNIDSNVVFPAAGNKMVMTLVYQSGTYKVYLNGALAMTASETTQGEGWNRTMASVLTGSTTYVGLVSTNAVTTFNNWSVTNNPTTISSFTSSISSRPALGTWQYGGGAQYTVSGGNLALKGAYTINGATVSTGSSYMLTATFSNNGADELGFMVTTDNNWNGTQKNLFIVRRTSDLYVWGENPGLWWNVSSAVPIPSSGTKMTMTLVYKSGNYKIFINGALAATCSETENGGGWNRTMASVLTGSTTYLGLVSTNTQTTFTNWAFSTNAAIIDYLAG